MLAGRPHIVDAMKNGDVHLVFNTSEGRQAMSDSFSLRQTALMGSIPYYTTVAGMRAAVEAIAALRAGALEVHCGRQRKPVSLLHVLRLAFERWSPLCS